MKLGTQDSAIRYKSCGLTQRSELSGSLSRSTNKTMLSELLVFNEVNVSLAYIDGGTGSLIFQALIGGFLTVGYFATTQWGRLKMKFASIVRKSNSNAEG